MVCWVGAAWKISLTCVANSADAQYATRLGLSIKLAVNFVVA
jgi:hypothetical protein